MADETPPISSFRQEMGADLEQLAAQLLVARNTLTLRECGPADTARALRGLAPLLLKFAGSLEAWGRSL